MGIGNLLLGLAGAGGTGPNRIAETLGAFRANAENDAARAAQHRSSALNQYAAEFHARENRTWLDALADGLNRLVRPVVTLGLLYPIPATVMDPGGMAQVWTAIATLPPGYWAIVGIVLPFYFGGRMQVKALAAARWKAAASAARDLVTPNQPSDPDPSSAWGDGPNAALDDWRAGR